jgi:hypothetical protein
MSARQSIARESAGFAAAEMASMGVSLGTVAVLNLVPKNIMHAVDSTIAKICIEPFLDTIEKGVSTICKLDECKPDKTKTRQERAENIAQWMVIGGAGWAASMGAKVLARRFLNSALHIPEEARTKLPKDAPMMDKIIHHLKLGGLSKEEKMIFLADETVHYGSLIYLNNKGAKFTDEHIRGTRSMLEKLGFSHKAANEMSTWIWVWEAPNILGMASGMAAVGAKHAYGWPTGHRPTSFRDIISGQAASAVHHTPSL